MIIVFHIMTIRRVDVTIDSIENILNIVIFQQVFRNDGATI